MMEYDNADKEVENYWNGMTPKKKSKTQAGINCF